MKTLCVGEILWDLLPSGPKVGGAPLNVALHLRRFGAESRFAGRVGNDPLGRELASFIEKEGIDNSLLQVDESLPTGTVEVTLGNGYSPDFRIIDNVAWDNIEPTICLDIAAQEADAIIFGTLASRHELTRRTVNRLIDSSTGLKVIDVNLRPPFTDKTTVEQLLFRADMAKMNDDELRTIAGWYHLALPENELIAWLAVKYSLELVCVTKGAQGAMLYEASSMNIISHSGFKVEAVDTVGAGDAFLAGFLYSFIRREPLEKALSLACATGALVATKCGATPSYDPNTDVIGRFL